MYNFLISFFCGALICVAFSVDHYFFLKKETPLKKQRMIRIFVVGSIVSYISIFLAEYLNSNIASNIDIVPSNIENTILTGRPSF